MIEKQISVLAFMGIMKIIPREKKYFKKITDSFLYIYLIILCILKQKITDHKKP